MQIVRGNPTPEEVAALVVVLTQLRSAQSDRAPGVATARRSADAWRRSEPVERDPRWRDWSSDGGEVTPPLRRPVRRGDRCWDRRVVEPHPARPPRIRSALDRVRSG